MIQLTAFGETHTISEWAALKRINPTTLRSRLSNGMSVDDALSMPVEIGRSNRKHGRSQTPVYEIWKSMRSRCNTPTDKNYANYGGRGISVCARWNSFPTFAEDMGPRPHGFTIERSNNDRGYEPGNCCWASRHAQNNNRRSNHVIVFEGKNMTITQAIREAGSDLTSSAVSSRLRSGWDTFRALTQPKLCERWDRLETVVQQEVA